MTTPNPMAKTYSEPPRPISKEIHCIAGILTTVYGLSELRADIHDVACLWLLHPRLQTQACMEPIAFSTINEWNARLQNPKKKDKQIGLIAVSFDQRNHGSREVHSLSNEAWSGGNKKHAQDMFTTYHGTALDTSHLLNYLTSYIFPTTTTHTLTTHLTLGVSLGGHAAWHCLLHDPHITAAIIIIGCPDYISLMTDRARLSKLPTWTSTSPPGSEFLGSHDFPKALIEAVEKYDPAGLLLGPVSSRSNDIYDRTPNPQELIRLLPLMKTSLQGKRILNMAGGTDKLVPYKCSEPFLRWLKKATAPNGWFGDGNVVVEDIVFEGVSHDMSPSMVAEVHRFVLDTLEQSPIEAPGRVSKI